MKYFYLLFFLVICYFITAIKGNEVQDYLNFLSMSQNVYGNPPISVQYVIYRAPFSFRNISTDQYEEDVCKDYLSSEIFQQSPSFLSLLYNSFSFQYLILFWEKF